MSSIVDELLSLRERLSIVQQSPGRLRVRWSAGNDNQSGTASSLLDLRRILEEEIGAKITEISLFGRTAVITYDAETIPPEAWVTLIEGSEPEARQALHRLLPPPPSQPAPD